MKLISLSEFSLLLKTQIKIIISVVTVMFFQGPQQRGGQGRHALKNDKCQMISLTIFIALCFYLD